MNNENTLPRALFIDRDGTLIVEPPVDYQVDSLEKLEFVPGALRAMHFIAGHLPYKLVMVTTRTASAHPLSRRRLSGPPTTRCLALLPARG